MDAKVRKVDQGEYGQFTMLVGPKLTNSIVALKLGYVEHTHLKLAKFFVPEGYEVVEKK